ncbi:MAG: mucoidy inhibitor MuiA family protein [Planctomycetota bacterium]
MMLLLLRQQTMRAHRASILLPLAGIALGLLARAPLRAQESAIVRVTVFEDRARVERATEVDLPAGVGRVRLEGLPASLVPTSVRATLKGLEGEILGVRLEWVHHREDTRAEVTALEEALAEKGALDRDLLRRLEIANKQLSLLSGYAAFLQGALKERSTRWTEKRDSVEEMLDAEIFLTEMGVEVAAEVAALQRERSELARATAIDRDNLRRIAAGGGLSTRTAEVVIDLGSAGAGTLMLAHDLPDASWEPLYEARLDEERGEVDWSCSGRVTQSSGEDWSGVDLVLSTTRSSLGLSVPELVPVRIAGRRADRRELSVGRQAAPSAEATRPAEGGLATAGEDAESIDLSQARIVGGAAPARFEIPTPAVIPGDGRPHLVSIFTATLGADLLFESAPSLKPHTYRRAGLVNTTTAPFLHGTVRVFREGAYVGNALLKPVAPGQAFRLYFGAEGRITVHRREIRSEVKSPGSLSGSIRVIIAYRFDIKNHLGDEVPLQLAEPIPVSAIEEVKVRLGDATRPRPTEVSADGIVRWELRLAPGEKREVILEYTVSAKKGVALPFDWLGR